MRKLTPIQQLIKKTLSQWVDFTDCHFGWHFGTPYAINPKFKQRKDKDGKPLPNFKRSVSNNMLDCHFSGPGQIYYRSRFYGSISASNPFMRCLLLGIDIDAHNNETDYQAVAELILEYLPNCYVEPSTSGHGRHLYLKTVYDCSLYSVETVQAGLTDLIQRLDQERIKRGLDSIIEGIYGFPSNNGIKSQCIKLPFFNMSDNLTERFNSFESSSVYLYPLIIDNLTFLPAGKSLEKSYYTLKCVCLSKATPLIDNQSALQMLESEDNSRTRRRGYCLWLSRQLKRVPTAGELKEAYQKTRLYRSTSRSDNDLEEYQTVVKYVARTFDPSKCGFDCQGYFADREEWVVKMQQIFPKESAKEVELLSALHWSMLHSLQLGSRLSTCFSHRQAQTALQQITGGVNNRILTTRLFRKLQSVDLISKTLTYISGKQGQPWLVGKLEDKLTSKESSNECQQQNQFVAISQPL